jgi:signal transduction histidine kinase
MELREVLFPPGATRHDWILDATMAGAIALLTLPPYVMRGLNEQVNVPQVVAAVLMVLPVVLRRHSPILMLAGVTVAGILQLIVASAPMATLAVVPMVAYTMARWIPGTEARWVVAIGGIASILGPVRWIIDDPAYISLKTLLSLVLAWSVCIGLVITPYAIGRRVREAVAADQDRVEAAEERYQRLLDEREQAARLAESKARSQIARELHDIVAHSLSVMIVQAEGGKAAAAKRPEAFMPRSPWPELPPWPSSALAPSPLSRMSRVMSRMP